MKRTIRGRPPRQAPSRSIGWPTVLGIALFVLVVSTEIARRVVARSGAPFWEIWAVAFFGMAFVGLLMLPARIPRALIGLTVVGALLRDAAGWNLGLPGALLWLLGAFWALALVLSFYAGYVAPTLNLEVSDSSYTGLRLLLRQTVAELLQRKPFQVTPGVLPGSFSTVGAGQLLNHQAIVIYKGAQFAGGLGPGYKMLRRDQAIRAVVDLRPQSRTRTLAATTRDGIGVEATITVRFCIRPPARATDQLPYPFDQAALREFVHADTVFRRDLQVGCYERVASVAALHLGEQLARQSLDQLYEVNARGRSPLTRIAEQVKELTTAEFKDKGLQIDAVAVAPLKLPTAVAQARLKQWEKGWKDAVEAKKLGSDIKPLDPAAAEHQMEVLDELHQNIQILRAAGNQPFSRAIADRLEQVVAAAAAEGLLRTLIPAPKAEK